MKKNLIALAVAGAMTAPAVALADLNISGGLQAEVLNIGGDGDMTPTGTYITDGGNAVGGPNSGTFGFLAFTASEELGGGLKAVAKHAMNLRTDEKQATRDSYIGLTGGFGTLLVGRMNQAYKTSTVKWDPFLGTGLQARGSGGMWLGLHGGEQSNMISYNNTFGAMKFKAQLQVDEAPDNADPSETNGEHSGYLSLNAPLGPIELALAYADESGYNVGPQDRTALKFGAKFSTGAFTVSGQMENLDEGYGATDDGSVYLLTGSMKSGNNTFSLSYGATDQELLGTTDDVTYLALGANHSFTKKTNVWAGYRLTDYDSGDESAISVGMRTKF